MNNLSLSVIPAEYFQILSISVNGVLDPRELLSVELPHELDVSHGVVIYGRGPIWLYTYLSHILLNPWIAVFDPRQGAIVVESHRIDAPPVGTTPSLGASYLK